MTFLDLVRRLHKAAGALIDVETYTPEEREFAGDLLVPNSVDRGDCLEVPARPAWTIHDAGQDLGRAMRDECALHLMDDQVENFLLFTVCARGDSSEIHCNGAVSTEFWPHIVDAMDKAALVREASPE